MKKFLIASLFILTMQCKAQDILPVTFGPLVSLTSTSLNSNPDFKDQIAGAGYNFGAFVRLKLLFFYGQGEASFGSKSASVSSITNGVSNNLSFKLKGIDISMIGGIKLFRIRDIGNVRIFGGYNWNNYSDISYSVDGNNFATSNVNKNNHSVLGGIGLDLSKFAFDLKYIKGFIDLTNTGQTDVESRVFNLTIAYKIL